MALTVKIEKETVRIIKNLDDLCCKALGGLEFHESLPLTKQSRCHSRGDMDFMEKGLGKTDQGSGDKTE
jgi:hypothetical protein